jgi:hypothetical protein
VLIAGESGQYGSIAMADTYSRARSDVPHGNAAISPYLARYQHLYPIDPA